MNHAKTTLSVLCTFLLFSFNAQTASAIKYSPAQSVTLAEDFLSTLPSPQGLERDHKISLRDNTLAGGSSKKTSKKKKTSSRSRKGTGHSKSGKRSSRKKKAASSAAEPAGGYQNQQVGDEG